MRPVTLAALAASLVSLPAAAADPSPAHAAPAPAQEQSTPAQAQLERLKALAGTWSGKAGPAGAPGQPTTVVWRVVSNGSAVMETIGPGTDHEMVTLYHLDGSDLLLTHYCSAGNQPTMRGRAVDASTLAFEFVRGTNIKPGDVHMRAARLTFVSPDRLETEWTAARGSQALPPMRFELARQR